MPYIILAIGVLLALYALYRFFMRANVIQIKALFLTLIAVVIALALFYLAITGRLPAALALLAALIPFGAAYFRQKASARGQENSSKSSNEKPMNREEALKILGLRDDASDEDIKDAYKSLMKKVHPDQEGSEWMAAKLNEAKDYLLKK